MRDITVFYVWQSDVSRSHNAISSKLQEACEALNESQDAFTFVMDRDTRNVAGAMPIDHVILNKIQRADIVVCDITPVSTIGGAKKRKSIPNPNVMFELGFAAATIGLERLLFLRDSREEWNAPFDIRQLRELSFSKPTELKSQLPDVLLHIARQADATSLPDEQAAELVRLMHSSRVLNKGSDLATKIAIELRLLATGEDHDMFSALADAIEKGTPWKNNKWPFTSNTPTAIREKLSAALLPNTAPTVRETSLAALRDYAAMIPLHLEREHLIEQMNQLGWTRNRDPIDGSTLLNWLENVEAIGGEVSQTLEVTLQIQASSAKDFDRIREQLKAALSSLSEADPTDLLHRHRALTHRRTDEKDGT